MKGNRWVLLVCCVLFAVPAWSDILITKTGRIFVGRIDEVEDGDEILTMRWPYGNIKEIGKLTFYLARDVRWFKRGSDAPDDTYWQEFLGEEIVADAAAQSAITQEELNAILTARAERLLDRLRGESPPPTAIVGDSGEPAPIAVSRAAELALGRVERDEEWAYSIRVPEGWEGEKHDAIHVWVGPEEDGFRPQLHVMCFKPPPVADLMGEHGLVSLTLDVSKNFADSYGSPRISAPEFDDATETQKCASEVTIMKGGRQVLARKVFIITGNTAYVLASYDLVQNIELRDKVIRQALASFEISR